MSSPKNVSKSPPGNRYSGQRGAKKWRREGNTVIIGSGVNCGLKPAQNKHVSEKKVTGVFTSKHHPHTTPRDIEDSIYMQTGLNLTVYKMRSNHPRLYSSFYISCRQKDIDTLLVSSLWPVGILVKPYEE